MKIDKPPFELTAKLANNLKQVERVHKEGYSKEYILEVVTGAESLTKSRAVNNLVVVAKRFAVSAREKPSAEEHVAIVALYCIYRAYIEDLTKVSEI